MSKYLLLKFPAKVLIKQVRSVNEPAVLTLKHQEKQSTPLLAKY